MSRLEQGTWHRVVLATPPLTEIRFTALTALFGGSVLKSLPPAVNCAVLMSAAVPSPVESVLVTHRAGLLILLLNLQVGDAGWALTGDNVVSCQWVAEVSCLVDGVNTAVVALQCCHRSVTWALV